MAGKKRRRAGRGEAAGLVRAALASNSRECFIWPFARIGNYGAWNEDLVHRHVCKAKHGPSPYPRAPAEHLCGQSLCFNWRHIAWSTPLVNNRRKLEHGTNNDGTRNGGCKLTVRQMRTIRNAPKGGAALAEKYGISKAQVWNIRTGKRWKRV